MSEAQNSTRYAVCFRFLCVKQVAVFFIYVGLDDKQGYRHGKHTQTHMHGDITHKYKHIVHIEIRTHTHKPEYVTVL